MAFGFESLEPRFVLAGIVFNEVTLFSGGLSRSQAVVLADVDGDFDQDVIALSGAGAALLRNEGVAGFSDIVDLPLSFRDDTRSLLVHDFDGDQDLDLIVGAIGTDDSPTVQILLNRGNGQFAAAQTLTTAADAEIVDAIDCADLDGDGDVDVVLADRGGRRVLQLLNHGDASFSTPIIVRADERAEPRSVIIADLDGKGGQDIAVALAVTDSNGFPTEGKVAWYRNQAGRFEWAGEAPTGVEPRFLDTGDFDSDGDQDLIVPEQGAGRLRLFVHQNGDPLALSTIVDSSIRNVERARFADVDGDDKLDLVITADSIDTVAWYRNQDGKFSAMRVIDDTTPQSSGLALGDLDGDGDLDVVSTSQFHAAVSFHRNDGHNAWTTTTITGPNVVGPEATLFADFDGDGDDDVLVLSEFDFEISWFENVDGSGRIDMTRQRVIADFDFSPNVSLWWDLDVADLDHDGHIDVVTTEPGNRDIVWYRNDGNGNFDEGRITGEQLGATEIEVFDIDGDGDNDLVAGNFYGSYLNGRNTITWYENDGKGRFAPHTVSQNVDNTFAELAVGDMDGDGQADILFGDNARFDAARVRLFRQQRSGDGVNFAEPVDVEQGQLSIEDVGLADMDGDMDLDAIVASFGQDDAATQIRWYENLGGQEGFASQPKLVATQAFVSELVFVDLDVDGDTDIVSPDPTDHALKWFENLGGGQFTGSANIIDSQIITGDTGFTERVMLLVDTADLNRDGLPDLVVPSNEDNRVVAFLGQAGDPYDFDGDGEVGLDDVNVVCRDFATGQTRHDVNEDGLINFSDFLTLVQDRVSTVLGDVDGDGSFSDTDIVEVFIAGEYHDRVAGNSLYVEGDWNCSGDFDTDDLVFVFIFGKFSVSVSATPIRLRPAISASLVVGETSASGQLADLQDEPDDPWTGAEQTPRLVVNDSYGAVFEYVTLLEQIDCFPESFDEYDTVLIGDLMQHRITVCI